jgi:hypothetical protein
MTRGARTGAALLSHCCYLNCFYLGLSGWTAMFCGRAIVYGDPGAAVTLVGVTVNTKSFPPD